MLAEHFDLAVIGVYFLVSCVLCCAIAVIALQRFLPFKVLRIETLSTRARLAMVIPLAVLALMLVIAFRNGFISLMSGEARLHVFSTEIPQGGLSDASTTKAMLQWFAAFAVSALPYGIAIRALVGREKPAGYGLLLVSVTALTACLLCILLLGAIGLSKYTVAMGLTQKRAEGWAYVAISFLALAGAYVWLVWPRENDRNTA
ncbi:MAG: hypothetical protein K1Y02_11870 [Candidatus Hydrogenedentes bacterium]|nr:hypothetical protein [Candidatus Hydrogenedentota bacterium]